MPDNSNDEREYVSQRAQKKFKLNFCVSPVVAGILPERRRKKLPRTHDKWLILELAIKIGNAFILPLF